jgi:hypothetical protein
LNEVANDPDAGTANQELWLRLGRYTYSAFGQQMFGMEVTDAKDPVIHYIFGLHLRTDPLIMIIADLSPRHWRSSNQTLVFKAIETLIDAHID